jgi:hypothetical protein
MQNDVDFNKLFSDSLFNGQETEYLQDKFLEENMKRSSTSFRCAMYNEIWLIAMLFE